MAFPTQKQVEKIAERVHELVNKAKTALEDLRDQIQDEYDEKSDKWQEGEKGEAWQALIGELEEQIDALDDVETYVPERPE